MSLRHLDWWWPPEQPWQISFQDRGVVHLSSGDNQTVTFRKDHTQDYVVEWRRHNRHDFIQRILDFSRNEIAAIAGLHVVLPDQDPNWLYEFSADIIVLDKFILAGDCLNIPCPSRGRFNEGSVSVLLNDRIRAALQQLIAESRDDTTFIILRETRFTGEWRYTRSYPIGDTLLK